MSMAATAAAQRRQEPQQEGRAADRGAGAVSRLLGNARQERADRRAQFPDRSVEPLEFLPGQEHPAHLDHRRRRAGQARSIAGGPTRRRRRRSTSRSTTGPRPRRATAPNPRRPAAKAKAQSSCRGAPSKSSTIAMNISRSTTTTSLHRPPSRSASCWRRRRSLPASRAELSGRGPRRARAGFHGARADRAAPVAFALTGPATPRVPRHAAADAPQQPQRTPAAFRADQAKHSPDAELDRVDQPMRPVEPDQDVLVEPAEPSHLQELGLGHLEHESSDRRDRPAWPKPRSFRPPAIACWRAATSRRA